MKTKEYVAYTKEDIEKANSVDLVDYLETQNEEFIKSGKDKRWKKHDSVTFRGNKWYRWKTSTGGYPIAFLEEFYDMTFQEAVGSLLKYINDGLISVKEITYNQTSMHTESEELIIPEKNTSDRKVINYLTKERFLDSSVVDEFIKQGLIYEDSRYHNAVFVGKDFQNNIKHISKRSVYKNSTYRGNSTNSDGRYPFRCEGYSNSLYVFESPIDMLSYIALHLNDWKKHSYLSMCGINSAPIMTLLKHRQEISQILIGTDNDKAGEEAYERLSDELKELGYQNVGRIRSENKDFNEDLKASNGKEFIKGFDNLNYKLRDTILSEIKPRVIKDMKISEKELVNKFANTYFNIKYTDLDYEILKNIFIMLLAYTINIIHFNDTDKSIENGCLVYDALRRNYRSYKDKGGIKQRLTNMYDMFVELKKVQDQQRKEDVKDCYYQLGNMFLMMIMECERKLNKKNEKKEEEVNNG